MVNRYFMKLSDEGTNSPFISRMYMAILEMRDLTVMTNDHPLNKQISSSDFDDLYDPIITTLRIALSSVRSLQVITTKLINDGLEGRLVKFYPKGGSEIINTQDIVIRKEFTSVVDNIGIVIKNHLPRLLSEIYDLDIGLLFQKESNFRSKVEALNVQGQDVLAKYLESVRPWTDQLINKLWNSIKHDRYKWEPIKLEPNKIPVVQVTIPTVFALPIDRYALQVFNRSCFMVEDLLAYAFQNQRESPICLVEVPKNERVSIENRRFQAMPTGFGYKSWTLEFKDEIDFS